MGFRCPDIMPSTWLLSLTSIDPCSPFPFLPLPSPPTKTFHYPRQLLVRGENRDEESHVADRVHGIYGVQYTTVTVYTKTNRLGLIGMTYVVDAQ